MPKKKPTLLHKLSVNLLKISIFLAKLKKPTILKLIILKKTRRLKRFKLLRDYSYCDYVKEYEFSPSSTPLIQFHQKHTQSVRISFRKLYSDVLFMSKCLRLRIRGEGEKEMEPCLDCVEGGLSNELAIDLSGEDDDDDDDCVDERAERFIRRFYEEMRRQRTNAMLEI